MGMSLERIVFIPDTHVPFHNKKAFNLVKKVIKTLGVNTMVTLGDFADFYSVSSHSKDPKRKLNLLQEINAVNKALDELDALGCKKKYYIEGNHEWRYARYIRDKAPELSEMNSIPKMFRLKERGWKFTPYMEHTTIGKLHLTHDTGKAGKTAHSAARADFGEKNVVIGHTHRMAYDVTGCVTGKTHVAAMFGWLGDTRQIDYMHRSKAWRDWPLGFGMGYKERDGTVHLVPIPIINNRKCCVEGRIISI